MQELTRGRRSPYGRGFPPRCLAGSRSPTRSERRHPHLPTQAAKRILLPKARLQVSGLNGSTCPRPQQPPPSTQGDVSLGEEAERTKPTIAREQNSGGRRERHLPDKQRACTAHSQNSRYMLFIFECFSKVQRSLTCPRYQEISLPFYQ